MNSIGEAIFVLQRGTPRDGPGGTLAGIAKPGARLEVRGPVLVQAADDTDELNDLRLFWLSMGWAREARRAH